ncbi:aggregation-promoting factor C-terminal-like domain-containing protein [Nocardiopsis oceani]
MTTPHRPELGDPRRPSSNRPPSRLGDRDRPPRVTNRRDNALRWFRPARRSDRDRGAGFVEMAAVTLLVAAIMVAVYRLELSSQFNEGVRQMVCLVQGPSCGDETWVDAERPDEPEEYEWGGSGESNVVDNQNIGMQQAENEFNWSGQEWTCLDNLWSQQSAWDHNVTDPDTGASGIVGFNPARHGDMPDGFEGSPATQIDWGLNYIDQNYGTPCAAWSYWQSTGSY